MLFQSLEILIALVAVWFVFRFIKMYTSHEVLDRKNKEIQSRLSKNQRRFSLLLTNLPGMAYRCKYDEKWTMIFVSQGSYELTGYYPDELMKNRITSYSDLIIPEDRSAVFAAVKESFHRGEPFKTTYRIRCKNGQTKWVWEQGRFTSTTASFKKLRVEGFITDINEAKILENEREKLIEELKNALAEIRELRGILPICASCKKIRDDKGYWQRIESYIQNHTNAEFSHGICPDCAKLLYPEFTLDDRD
jgi:PAS domain S-box-containing protein